MSNKPKVSVIIPTYNRSKLLRRAVESVLNQTYKDFEVIIVDDNSSDETQEVGESLAQKNKKVCYIRHKFNKGAPAARNEGIKKAKGKYIGLLDDDDKYRKEKLQLQVKKFESNSRLGLVYGGFRVIRETSDKKPVDKLPKYKGDTTKPLLKNCVIGSPTVLVKKEAFDKVGKFDVKLTSCQDWDMWYRIAKKYSVDYVNKVVADYYLHQKEQITSNFDKKIQGAYRLYKKQLPDLNKYPKIKLKREKMMVRFLAAGGRRKKALSWHWQVFKKEPFSSRNLKLLLLLIFNFSRYKKRAQKA